MYGPSPRTLWSQSWTFAEDQLSCTYVRILQSFVWVNPFLYSFNTREKSCYAGVFQKPWWNEVSCLGLFYPRKVKFTPRINILVIFVALRVSSESYIYCWRGLFLLFYFLAGVYNSLTIEHVHLIWYVFHFSFYFLTPYLQDDTESAFMKRRLCDAAKRVGCWAGICDAEW